MPHFDDDDPIDASEATRLAAWFGLPTSESPTAPATLGSHKPARAAEALGAVFPELVARLWQVGQRAENLAKPIWQPAQRPEMPDAVLLAPVLVDPVDRETPDELKAALAEQVPQALLRDLHRPVVYFERMLTIDEGLASLARTDHVAQRRAAFNEARGMPQLEGVHFGNATLAEARNIRRQPWAPLGRDASHE